MNEQLPILEQTNPTERPTVVMTRDMFPVGSIGYLGFDPRLEGRTRPEIALKKRLESRFTGSMKAHYSGARNLREADITTIGAVLSITHDQYFEITRMKARGYVNSLSVAKETLNQLLYLPHAQLLRTAIRNLGGCVPTPPEQENHVIQTVEAAVDSLGSMPFSKKGITYGEVLRAIYDFDSWTGINRSRAARTLGVDESWVEQKHRASCWKLRHLVEKDTELQAILPFVTAQQPHIEQ